MRSVRLNANNIVSGVGFEPEDQYIRDGPDGMGEWRLRNADEYRSYKPEPHVENWIW